MVGPTAFIDCVCLLFLSSWRQPLTMPMRVTPVEWAVIIAPAARNPAGAAVRRSGLILDRQDQLVPTAARVKPGQFGFPGLFDGCQF